MVAFKAAAVPSFLKSPDPDCRAVLLYGPDAGLVTMRAAALANALSEAGEGAAEIVRIDDRDLGEDPARLEIELLTIPMFSARKIVRATAGARLDVTALKVLLDMPLEGALIIEAGNLRPDSALRKLFEKHTNAAALPCYAEERNLAGLIADEMKQAGLSIDAETKAYLMARLGADQALSRSEIGKLATFAANTGRVSEEDVDAIVGDSAEIAVEAFVYEVSGGNTKEALRQLQRLTGSGTETSSALNGLARHFMQLHAVAAALGQGSSAEQAVRQLRPRPHFKRETAFVAHSRRWGPERLLAAMPMIQEAVTRTRRFPELERDFAERLVLALHQKAA